MGRGFKAPFLYQHDIFYREASLQEPYYSFVIGYDRDGPALNNLNALFLIRKI